MTRARELADLLTGGQTITTSGSGDALAIESTDAGDTFAPDIAVFRNSSSPADNDGIGLIDLRGRNDNSQDVSYAQIQTSVTDVSDGAEDGFFSIKTMVAGTLRSRMEHSSSETVFNQDSIDIDFRVESDGNTHGLFLEASSGEIGIGEDNPATTVHITASAPALSLNTAASMTSGNRADINVYNSDSSGVGLIRFGAVTDNVGTNMQFYTRPASGSLSERMRVTSDGSFLVGTTSYDGSHFNDTSGGGFAVKSDGKIDTKCDGTVANFNMTSSSGGNILYFAHEGTGVGSIGIQTSGFYIDGESGHEGIRFANGSITPRENGSDSDGASDLGASNNRFKDGYFSNIVYSTYLRGQNDTDTGIDVGNTGTANTLVFHTGGSERARIDSAGHLLIATGGGTQPSSSRSGVMIKDTSAGAFTSFSDTTNTSSHGVYGNTNGVVGSIQTTNSSTAFNTSSDYRLKENVEYGWDATSRLKQLKPARFNFIANADITVDGFLAHEVSSIVPEAITGTKDETRDVTDAVLSSDGKLIGENIAKDDWAAGKLETKDAEGNSVDSIYPSDSTWTASHTEPVLQQIDQSKLVPLLVKTILELEARVATLEAS